MLWAFEVAPPCIGSSLSLEWGSNLVAFRSYSVAAGSTSNFAAVVES